MGTFHDDRGELHGITVVVDTIGRMVYIGRCHEMDDERVVLRDVDEHEDGQEGTSKEEFVQRAARFGFWNRHQRLVVPRADVTSIRRLGEIAVD